MDYNYLEKWKYRGKACLNGNKKQHLEHDKQSIPTKQPDVVCGEADVEETSIILQNQNPAGSLRSNTCNQKNESVLQWRKAAGRGQALINNHSNNVLKRTPALHALLMCGSLKQTNNKGDQPS